LSRRQWIGGQAVAAGHGRRVARRRWAERLVRLAADLPLPERRLVEQVYAHGQSLTHLAAAAGIHRSNLSRRLARILRRMRHPMFAFVLTRPDAIPPEMRALARMRFVEGRSLRHCARSTRRTLHAVRQDAATLITLARLQEQTPPLEDSPNHR